MTNNLAIDAQRGVPIWARDKEFTEVGEAIRTGDVAGLGHYLDATNGNSNVIGERFSFLVSVSKKEHHLTKGPSSIYGVHKNYGLLRTLLSLIQQNPQI